ncbi:PREDICTED: protein FAM162A [Elephantulus edwardii]|uniref:protein FAM162A n=1 Tax=Elephantulus edwardii TaxID=28737 RepID=UPI0003F0941B|nr:PREDICTED: protein FAM162A [Elephantulus edwardii]
MATLANFKSLMITEQGKIVVNLTGRLNKCDVTSPRFDVQLKDLEKWQNNLLPSYQFGFTVLTTSAGHFFQLYERDVFSSLRLSRNTGLKRINGFCTKPQESPKAPSHPVHHHRVPLHKPTDWEKKILIWSGRFKKEDEIPETITFQMLDAAKNRLRVKVSYLMIALTVAGCIVMIIEGKKAARRHESLTSLNLEKKARLREEAMKAKAE